MSTKLVLLGTGTPNAEINNSGPCSAVVVDDEAYLVDFGAGCVRQANKAYFNGIDALRVDKLDIAFCTHLHTDHTVGLADLIFTPWVLERKSPLKLYGPVGLKDMATNITHAYAKDLDMRLNGDEPANLTGYQTQVHELQEGILDYGIIYEDDKVQVNAFTVQHGLLQALSYKFITKDKTIVISGDTCPTDIMTKKCKDVDILLHECEFTEGLQTRNPQWQTYHKNVHTLSVDLGKMCSISKPKQLITYHRIYHMNMLDNTIDINKEIQERNQKMIQEIRSGGYEGIIHHGEDFEVYE